MKKTRKYHVQEKHTAEWNFLIYFHFHVSSAKCLLFNGHDIFSKANQIADSDCTINSGLGLITGTRLNPHTCKLLRINLFEISSPFLSAHPHLQSTKVGCLLHVQIFSEFKFPCKVEQSKQT